MESPGYLSGECNDYKDESFKTKTVQRVVMPLKLVEGINGEGNRKWGILTGCSHYKSCHNADCSFSWVSRERSFNKREESR